MIHTNTLQYYSLLAPNWIGLRRVFLERRFYSFGHQQQQQQHSLSFSLSPLCAMFVGSTGTGEERFTAATLLFFYFISVFFFYFLLRNGTTEEEGKNFNISPSLLDRHRFLNHPQFIGFDWIWSISNSRLDFAFREKLRQVRRPSSVETKETIIHRRYSLLIAFSYWILIDGSSS